MAPLRKQIIPSSPRGAHATAPLSDRIDVPAVATALVTSESAEHPIDHVFDGRDGPGGTRWVASEDGPQTIIVAFDTPQTLSEIAIETEETHRARTQVLTLAISRDGGETYQEIVRQEFNFSPPDTTFERERWRVPAERVTHVRVTVQPDKGNAPARATLTSLAIA